MAQISVKQMPKLRFAAVGNKSALVDRVVRSIQEQILSERLPVGTKLPPEREFAERLGVSRTVVREAMRVLAAKGLLETSHGVGTTVKALTREEAVKPLNLFLRSLGREISLDHLHQVRSLIEIENTRLAAERGSDNDLDGLQQILTEMQAAKDDPELFASKDTEFHRRLAETTHNPLLILLLDSIGDLMIEVRKLVAKEDGLVERVMPAHAAILECIRARDEKKAQQMMREHLLAALDIQKRAILSASEQIKI
ncbi:MAG: FadR/GntR family transcriptional regulator [Terracidiphilus sp.]|jgi:DNA-binding FadR family transcriptional regulator